MHRKTLYIIVITLVSTVIAQDNVSRYSYRFTDSSVPPRYHRSYEIIVQNGTVQFSVDSYGEVLYTETNPIGENELADFVKKLNACNLANKKETMDDGCSGGTGVRFSIQSSSANTYEGYEYYCANKTYGNMSGKVDDAVRLFKSLVSDFSLKLDGTRK